MSIPVSSEQQVRLLAKEILREPEFARWRRVSESFSWEWLEDWIRWLAGFLSGTADVSLGAYILFWGTLLFFAVLLVLQVIWTIRAARGVRAAPVPVAAGTEDIDLRARAESFAREGRFLDAAHCLHLACIEGLLRRGVLHLSRSDPNSTLRRRLLRSSLPARDIEELCALLDRMETSWFRTRHEDASLYDAWRALHQRLLLGVPA